MLSRWLDRGLGQIVAPDEAAAEQPVEPEGNALFWRFVAPDPHYESQVASPGRVRAPPSSAFLSPSPSHHQTRCVHCNQWTPTQYEERGKDMFHTPQTSASKADPELEDQVLTAAKDTASSMISAPSVTEERKKVFRICATNTMNEKLAERLRKYLTKDPSLIEARAAHFGSIAPDGMTPLMTCSYSNNVEAARIIYEINPKSIYHRDMLGKCALHIAAEQGNVEMVQFLSKRNVPIKSPFPKDLNGKTPFAAAVLSPVLKARQNRSQMEESLFSPDDSSVRGDAIPAASRSVVQSKLELAYGYAVFPGRRVRMEDAVCALRWETNGKPYVLVGVCDGHGDHGMVSNFIADNAPVLLQENMPEGTSKDVEWIDIWTKSCLALDERLRQSKMTGGSTGVFALLSSVSVVVANVGDSRCILIQKPEVASLEKRMEQLTVMDTESSQEGKSEEGEKPPEQPTEADDTVKENEPKEAPFVVVPLSDDHKPSRDDEQDRVEKAGLKVVAEHYEEKGILKTIFKVQLSQKDNVAVSRSFGDFEYKANSAVAETEQAVVAVPDVLVHPRNAERDCYLVLASDGVWDVMSNEEVAQFVFDNVDQEAGAGGLDILPVVGDRLLNECLDRGSSDNMSVVLVALSKSSEIVSASQSIEGKTLRFA